MRTDKDEIARLKAENLALQSRVFAEKPAPVAIIAKPEQSIDAEKIKKDFLAVELKLKKSVSDNENLQSIIVGLNENVSELNEKAKKLADLNKRLELKIEDMVGSESYLIERNNDLLLSNKKLESDNEKKDKDLLNEIKKSTELYDINQKQSDKIAENIIDLKNEKAKIETLNKDHEREIVKINSELSDALTSLSIMSKKIECINMLKIRNSELEATIFEMSSRLQRAEGAII